MPCRYDPSPEEIREMENEKVKNIVAPYVKKLDALTKLLCSTCKYLEDLLGCELKNSALKPPPTLITWWNGHQKGDEERSKIEDEKKRLKRLTKTALAKLTKEEKEVLGLF